MYLFWLPAYPPLTDIPARGLAPGRMSDHGDSAASPGITALHAVRAHLLEMAGDLAAARVSYQIAARRATSLPEQRYLEARAARLTEADG